MTAARTRKLPLPNMSSVNMGSEYEPEEIEFIKAIQAWRSENHRHPTMIELLAIAKGLGWRKEEPCFSLSR